MIKMWVPGTPVPQGSMRSVGPGRLIHSNAPALIDWRETVRFYAAQKMGDAPLITGPVYVLAEFHLPRPTSRPKRDMLPDRKPDLDKLVRAILDALTGTVIVDDARVVQIYAGKRYADDSAGAFVEVHSACSGQHEAARLAWMQAMQEIGVDDDAPKRN